MKLDEDFYGRDALKVARELLGKTLVHTVAEHKDSVDNVYKKVIKGRIVETEAYIGLIDRACHAYGGKRTKKIEPLYSKAGTVYVYSIYGMYYCFNVITQREGIAEGVLIRAVEPVANMDCMADFRYNKKLCLLSKKEILNMTSGPSKLCIAMGISKKNNMENLFGEDFYIENSPYYKTKDNEELYNMLNIRNECSKEFEIVEAKRIGIDYAKEAKDFLWRFYIKDNIFVFKKA